MAESIAQAVRRLAEDLEGMPAQQALARTIAARLAGGACGQDPMPPETQDEPPPSTGTPGPGTGGGGGEDPPPEGPGIGGGGG